MSPHTPHFFDHETPRVRYRSGFEGRRPLDHYPHQAMDHSRFSDPREIFYACFRSAPEGTTLFSHNRTRRVFQFEGHHGYWCFRPPETHQAVINVLRRMYNQGLLFSGLFRTADDARAFVGSYVCRRHLHPALSYLNELANQYEAAQALMGGEGGVEPAGNPLVNAFLEQAPSRAEDAYVNRYLR